MNILLIDNGTSYLSKLLQLLSNHSYQIVKYFNINTVNFEHFDATILSGGHGFSVMQNEGRFSKEVDFPSFPYLKSKNRNVVIATF